ncbi:MAG TPA: ribosome biogenesis/translation initiation ATPase RLI, partial [Candidatus Woesearchaeota archaeon]|nr:ribosome biogenesis/translation initiation ATPase RLI [Candidatus Woesearchaeota archaeon]
MARRLAIVRKDRCNPVGCGNYLCARLCPVNMQQKDCIIPDPDSGKARIDENLCTGCGICVNRCPFDAITIVNLPEALDKPIHRFGMNGFHLFSLPTPIFGKVVGILGRNGIGKSTAVKILAGIIKPNLGKDEPASYEELVNFFKGHEAQRFFESLRDGKIVVSYKPQQIDLLPKNYKGSVQELLKKVDETGKFDDVVDSLSLRQVLDRDISQLSGGELQRMAIAATVLKKANVYFFDEPTSYLDIKQRILVSKFIKQLADEDTAVLVIEHDLIILDFMTDLVHIMYGKEGAFGVVSLPKATRSAINTYLSGYIKEENMRFRDHEISFVARREFKDIAFKHLVGWNSVKKDLGGFHLKALQGEIGRKESIGVLGENGIGKTTFIRILAGEIKPDSGSLSDNVKVAYKPQYLESDSDLLVGELLSDALKHFKHLFQPLDLHPLLTKKLSELSGGELQRVSIAYTLSKDAEIFLLDEPSAYLDVEQRLLVAKIIREVAEER